MTNIKLTGDKNIDYYILLQLPWNTIKILAEETTSRKTNKVIPDETDYDFRNYVFDELLPIIIKRDFNEELLNNKPRNISLVNYYDELDRIVNNKISISFIQFLIRENEKVLLQLLLIYTNGYYTNPFKILRKLLSLNDMNSIIYLSKNQLINKLNIICIFIERYTLQELEVQLKLLSINLECNIDEYKNAINAKRLDIIKYIESNNPEVLEVDDLSILREVCKTNNLKIYKHFEHRLEITINHVVYFDWDIKLFRYIWEKYNSFTPLSVMHEQALINKAIYRSSLEVYNYIKSQLPNLFKSKIYYIYLALKSKNIELILFHLKELERMGLVNNRVDFSFTNSILEFAMLQDSIEVVECVFQYLHIEYTNDILNMFMKNFDLLTSSKHVLYFLCNTHHLKFTIFSDDISQIIYKFKLINFILNNLSGNVDKDVIANKVIDLYTERSHTGLKPTRTLCGLQVKKLKRKYLDTY